MTEQNKYAAQLNCSKKPGCEELFREKRDEEIEPEHCVDFFAWCFEKIHKTSCAELADPKVRARAVRAAKERLDRDFAGDRESMADYMRFVCGDDRHREKWRLENGVNRPLDWADLFRWRKLLTRYAVDRQRRGMPQLPSLSPANDDAERPPAFVFMMADQLGEELPPPTWLSRRLGMAAGRPNLLSGYGGAGKTMLVQELALAVASGSGACWGGVPVELKGPVRHLDYEQASYLTRQRYQRLALAAGLELGSLDLGVAVLPRTSLADAEAELALMRDCEGVALCIVDNLRAANSALSENDSTFRASLDALTRVSEATGCVFVVLVHDGKSGDRPAIQRTRGSSAITDAAGCVLSIVVRDEVLTIEHAKSSYGRTQQPWSCRFEDVGAEDPLTGVSPALRIVAVDQDELDADREADKIDQAKASILAALGASSEPLTQGKVLDRAKGNNDTRRQALDELIRAGAVMTKTGDRGAILHWLAKA